MDIKPEYIDSLAPNAAAAANGRDLARKGRLRNLKIARDGTLLLGQCSGSGKEDYSVSADFINPAGPAFRCTCPSRQFPCKHALGLLYACAGGAPFTPCDIPQDILDKRQKAARRQRQTKRDEVPADAPVVKKASKAALVKKIRAQIEGLGILEKIVLEIASSGLGLLNRQRSFEYLEQAKQLSDHYLPGAQAALRGFLLPFSAGQVDDAIQTRALAELGRLHALAARGREYLMKRAESPEADIDRTTEMEELLGNAWQLSQLKELGMAEKGAELVQLSFRSYYDEAAMEFVDEGLWINLHSGAIVKTLNLRPYKAVKYIKEDDSFFLLARVKELAIYPGELNPRVRWEEMEAADLAPEHYRRILSHANASYAEAVKAARNVLKNPLGGGRFPAFSLKFARIGDISGETVMENAAGERLVLADAQEYPPSAGNLHFLTARQMENAALLGVFHQAPGGGMLRFHPLSVVWPGGIVRLAY